MKMVASEGEERKRRGRGGGAEDGAAVDGSNRHGSCDGKLGFHMEGETEKRGKSGDEGEE